MAKRAALVFLLAGFVFFFLKGEGAFENGKTRINLVMSGNPVVFFSFNPKDGEEITISIPGNTYIEVPRGFGFYPASSIFNLGEIDKKGGKLLSDSIQDFLGVPVDGWINTQHLTLNTQHSNDILDFLGEIRNYGRLETNLSPFEILRLFLLTRNIRENKTDFIDLGENGCLSDFILADGTKVLKGEESCLDFLVKENLFEEEIRRENLSIKIVNTTDVAGLGAKGARIIENIGGRVLRVETGKEDRDKTEILAEKKLRGSQTVKRLTKVLEAKVVEGRVEDFDLVIFLGKDYQSSSGVRLGGKLWSLLGKDG